MQIAGGTSIKKLQALLGHKSAMETWDTYGHLMGDEDDRSRTVIQGALAGMANSADSTRTLDPADRVSAGEPGWCGRAGL